MVTVEAIELVNPPPWRLVVAMPRIGQHYYSSYRHSGEFRDGANHDGESSDDGNGRDGEGDSGYCGRAS